MALIRIWVYDDILASGVSGPTDIFTAANHFARKDVSVRGRNFQPFAWSVESIDGRPVRTASGQTVSVDGKIDARKRADAILLTAPFVANMDDFMARRDQLRALSSAVRRRHEAGSLIASYCTGSFLLAEAGILDGRIATTHWANAVDFERRYPKVELRANEILTEQDGILCGGAVTSFQNLSLRLVEMFSGAALASTTAKGMLIDANRISQASYATLLDEHGHTDRLVARAQRRMETTVRQRFQLSKLAAHLGVSERTLNRRFKLALGQAPLEYLQTLRVEVAKQLLEAGRTGFDAVSERVGYGDPSTFRQLFKRKTGLSPREYQRRFAQSLIATG